MHADCTGWGPGNCSSPLRRAALDAGGHGLPTTAQQARQAKVRDLDAPLRIHQDVRALQVLPAQMRTRNQRSLNLCHLRFTKSHRSQSKGFEAWRVRSNALTRCRMGGEWVCRCAMPRATDRAAAR